MNASTPLREIMADPHIGVAPVRPNPWEGLMFINDVLHRVDVYGRTLTPPAWVRDKTSKASG